MENSYKRDDDNEDNLDSKDFKNLLDHAINVLYNMMPYT